jgi:hypothetical protein
MYNGIICVCDSCGQVLRGKVGTAEIHKRYIELKGTYDIAVQDYDKSTSTNTFVYVTDKIRKDKLHFCFYDGKDCLKDWIVQKEYMYKENRRKYLEEEANFNPVAHTAIAPKSKPYPQSSYWNQEVECR